MQILIIKTLHILVQKQSRKRVIKVKLACEPLKILTFGQYDLSKKRFAFPIASSARAAQRIQYAERALERVAHANYRGF